jgi:hypothetical protein
MDDVQARTEKKQEFLLLHKLEFLNAYEIFNNCTIILRSFVNNLPESLTFLE